MNAVELENHKGLRGTFPNTIGNMVNLGSISVLFAGARFGGVLPSSLFSIPSLRYISFYFNEGAWEFPESIDIKEQDSALEAIQFAQGGLTGKIPVYISEFKNLVSLDFAKNSLEGVIPDSFGGLLSLEYLNLHNNRLNGTLPTSLGSLENLTALALGENDLQGNLPSQLGDLSKLVLLELGNNKLTGPIPGEFSKLSALEIFSVQHNSMNGSISALESLKSLNSLSLYGNSFSSTIPTGLFASSTQAVFADLGHNKFTGRLPQQFLQLAVNTSEY